MFLKKFLLFIIIFVVQTVSSQNPKIVRGTIKGENVSMEGVRVINLNNEIETFTNSKGEFEILSKTGDLLIFSSMSFERLRILVNKDQFETGQIIVEMIPKVIELEEVKIYSRPEFDAVKLGILSKPAKVYTPAERRLNTAMSGGLGLIFNSLSGKLKMLKKEVQIEKKEKTLTILGNMFEDSYYTKELKIKSEKIGGFQYYAVEDQDLVLAIYSKNKSLVSFNLVRLAFEFNLLQEQ